MKIYTDKGQYDLPTGFALEIEKKNPFFNSIGEKSLPITLPPTSNNKKLIGHGNINGREKPAYKFTVTIEDGINIYSAKQVVHSISKTGINCTFYLGLSKFWDTVNNSKVRELLDEKNYMSSNLYNDLIRAMDWGTDYDFVVFPVAVKFSSDTYFIVNEVELIEGVLQFVGKNERFVKDGDIKTKCPPGYGIAPFLKANRILRILIEQMGYKLRPSFLDQEPFSQMVFINNVADAVTAGKIRYSQLVADITVQEFLNIFRKRFNVEFIPHDADREIEIKHFDEACNSNIKDLSLYIDGDMAFDYKESFSRILISIKKDSETKAESDTLQEVIDKYETITTINENQWNNAELLKRFGCVYRVAEDKIYAIEMGENEIRTTEISSLYFNWDTKETDLKEEKIELIDEAVNMVQVNNLIMPLAGAAVHLNTKIKDQESSTSKIEYPVKLAFSKKYIRDSVLYSYGSTSEYNHRGEKDINYSLHIIGEDGIYNKFYKNKDAILRNSNYILTTNLLLPEAIKNNFIGCEKIIINNQAFVPDVLAYTLGVKKVQECKFRSTRLFEPIVEFEQIIINDITEQRIYYWKQMTNMDELLPDPPSWDSDWAIELIESPQSPETLIPTPEQYEAGGKYFIHQIQGKLLLYVQGNTDGNYTLVNVTFWYEAAYK